MIVTDVTAHGQTSGNDRQMTLLKIESASCESSTH
jgi:hypothetical protein